MANAPSEKRHLRRLYRNTGETDATKELSGDVEFVIIETINGGHRVECDLKALFPEGAFPPPCMGRAAAAFGLNTVVGNAVAGKDKDDPEEVHRMMQARWDSIAGGEWSEGRQGPLTADVIAAWAADAINRGKQVTDASREAVKAKLKSGEWSVKGLLDIPGIQVEYQKAIVAKQQAKLAEAQAKAGTGDTTSYDID